MTAQPMRIAIIGGGLAGTLLMNALVRHAQFDVQLYEAKSEIQERGASVGLSINAQRALQLLGFEDLTRRAHAVKVGCLKLIVGEGPDAGELIYDVDFGKKTVHRAALLKELLAPIQKDRIHLSKRLTSIEGTTIAFDDGTRTEADVVIGADGIHSGVRKFVLDAGHPNVAPVPAGFWDTRVIVPRDAAVQKLGNSCINENNPHQHIHIGSKGVILHDWIDDGKHICIVATGPLPQGWDASKWKHEVSREWLYEEYAGWGDYGRNAIDLVLDDRTGTSVFMQWESAKTPTLCNGNICMIGDAAHACSPWQGTGLSQAIEDILILERVLERCKHAQDLPLALQAFDQVRRQHGQEVVDSSRKAGESYFSAWPKGAVELRRDIPDRQYILNWDTEGAINDAVATFERLQQ